MKSSSGHEVSCRVNGRDIGKTVHQDQLLVEFIREDLQLKGTNVGCDTSQCGACTILVDGLPVKSCTFLAVQADGKSITTIEGIATTDGKYSEVQQAFHEHHALQCGYCTPGMIMTTVGMLSSGEPLDEAAVRHGLEGNLCRCTGYQNIVRAILSLAAKRI